jgi:hypothetical protein
MALPGILGQIGAGPLFTGFTSLFGGAAANVSREQQASRQMQFQERMSSTAYQRAMQDMREAGLNPILAAKVGPASSPAGAMANIQDIGTPAAQAATSAYQAQTQRQQQEESAQLSRAQANVADKTAEKIVAETSNLRVQGEVLSLTVKNLAEVISQTGQNTRVLEKQAELIAEQIKGARAGAVLKNIDAATMKKIDDAAAGGSGAFKLLQMIIQVLK